MRTIFAVFVALIFVAPAYAAPTYPPVRVVFVEGPGYRDITPQRAALYRSEIALALAYWRDAGAPIPDAAPAEHWMRVDKPVTDWRFAQQFFDPKWTTIVIVQALRWDYLDMGGGARAGGDSRTGVILCLSWNNHYAYEAEIDYQSVGACAMHEAWHIFAGTANEGDPAIIDGQHSPAAHPRWGRDDYIRLNRPHPSDAALMAAIYQ